MMCEFLNPVGSHGMLLKVWRACVFMTSFCDNGLLYTCDFRLIEWVKRIQFWRKKSDTDTVVLFCITGSHLYKITPKGSFGFSF